MQLKFSNIKNAIFKAYKKAADLSMQKACQEIKGDYTNLKTHDEMTMIRIHIDYSWQKIGHSSMNSYASGVNNSKVIDKYFCPNIVNILKFGSIRRTLMNMKIGSHLIFVVSIIKNLLG